MLNDHPEIIQTMKTGYPNLVAQPEYAGIDFFGNEILSNDSIAEDREQQETILSEHLDGYLQGQYGFVFANSQHASKDFYNDEIEVNDSVVFDSIKGRVVLKENLEHYLELHYNFKFTIAD
ncbi:hypothetical protein J6TS2_50490 [Heyndrickxia sporothermodurans]|nr:hypothetical protein J6TS2_50490 [Heyndrickxia sporothermodurans]